MTERQAIGPRTVGEIATFVELLHAACEDKTINTALERLLSLPDENRRALVRRWVAELQVKDAPREFAEAIGCLVDDRVAEEAYEVIFRCRR